MNDELKQLIEDAAKLLWLEGRATGFGFIYKENNVACVFNPCDPDRGDLMKVADAAGLLIDFKDFDVFGNTRFTFAPKDYQSLALAVLRAASAVWKARGGE